jgi:hypothetical protein
MRRFAQRNNAIHAAVAKFAAAFAVLVFLVYLPERAGAQQTPPAAAAPNPTALPAVDDAFVKQRFGTEFTLKPEFAPIKGDFDGDGVEDLLLVAQTKNPLIDAGGFEYVVQDPYHAFFGFGDPKITAGFASDDPERRGFVLLMIHGVGADSWRAAKPKAKYVLINVPFKQILGLRRVMVKKKIVSAIAITEYGGTETTSAIYWDGKKKYKYEPLGSAMD